MVRLNRGVGRGRAWGEVDGAGVRDASAAMTSLPRDDSRAHAGLVLAGELSGLRSLRSLISLSPLVPGRCVREVFGQRIEVGTHSGKNDQLLGESLCLRTL